MPKFIVKLGDKYCEWSTIVDAPTTYLMTENEFTEYVKFKYGEEGVNELPKRMERVQATGTSSLDGTTVKDLVSFNRAGPNETSLSIEDLVEEYTQESSS